MKKLQDELKKRYSQISAAEEQLSEALLNAHATTAEGQRKLNDIQKKIVEAVNNPALSLDTPAGEETFLKFLRTQVAAIGDVLVSGTLSAEDQSKAIAALSNLYAADQGDTGAPSSPGAGPPAQSPTGPSEPSPSPATPSPQVFDPGPESAEPMPDPTLSDLGVGGLGAPVAPDPLSSLASTLPAAMGAIPPTGGLGSTPLDPLSGLAGAAAPLAGLASQLGDRAERGGGDSKDTSGHKTNSREPDTGDPKDKGQQHNRNTPQEPAPAQPSPERQPGEDAPAGALAAAPAPATSVQLPDGSTATARTPALAQAVKAYLAGPPSTTRWPT